MASEILDEELSMSLPTSDSRKARPSIPSIISPPQHPQVEMHMSESPGTQRAINRLNQYQFIRNIGEGSFGKVKLARHKVTGQEVAMKTISRRKLISRDMAGRIEREIQYLQLLRHPHIIKLYTVITTKTEIYMVLEYVPMELFDYIVKHGRLGEAKARRLFQQIICAVEYCHRHKIVHRDLKPENLLLDKDMNVKIADFGLSNIMTDGNFLKTSCGSPNYAAPEVIGGKLYAGPEVDVWSCGVILYVFLVGRLPFDDDFIPTLFKKIQAGNFHVPSSLPSGAVNLIKRCLQVHPVHRITIPEIRQDPWFIKDLPAYLVDPVEEFLDTGVDPAKAIDPRQLAPGKPPEVSERIHEDVVGQLGRKMGYAKEDVKDALSKDEPSAIKDAYLIVRENQMMAATASHHPEITKLMPGSPPVESGFSTFIPASVRSAHRTSVGDGNNGTPRSDGPYRSNRTFSDTPSVVKDDELPRVSNVRVLNTSLPHVHLDLMKVREKAKEAGEDPDSVLHPSQVPSDQSPDSSPLIPEEQTIKDTDKPVERSKEEQEATSKALKPHSRSVTSLSEHRGTKDLPEKLTTMNQAVEKDKKDKKDTPSTKKKPNRWQFGIRSRNAPFEAMKCLYNSLKAIDAVWEIDPALKQEDNSDNQNDNDSNKDDQEDRESQGMTSRVLVDGERHRVLQEKYTSMPPDYYITRDPWFIRARILKKGLFMPGAAPSSSTRSSGVNLPAEAQQQLRRHVEELRLQATDEIDKVLGMNKSGQVKPKSQPNSGQNTRPNSGVGETVPSGQDAFTGPGQQLSRDGSVSSMPSGQPRDDIGVWTFIDIQLYMLDTNTFTVDFKCEGYQNVVLFDPTKSKSSSNGSVVTSPASSRPTSGFEKHDSSQVNGEHDHETPYWKAVTKRYRNKEKEVSSPYPYMDVASDLVAQLAAQSRVT